MIKYVLSLFLLTSHFSLIGQSGTNYSELPRLILPTPDAAALGRYGNTDVGLFKGEANVTIPLINYNYGNVTVPIALTYNTTGIKVNDLASNVGLGWSLQAGGLITKVIKGQRDFSKRRVTPDITENFDPNDLTADWRIMDSVVANKWDTEPDIHYFNFLGKSGRYVFTNDTIAVPIPFQPLKIEFGSKITDNEGVQYFFEIGDILEIEDFCTTGNANPRDVQGYVPSSSFLSKVIHPKGDTVFFEYEDYQYSYKDSRTQTKYLPFNPIFAPCGSFGNEERDCISVKTVNTKRIKKIRSNRTDVYIEFIYNSTQREDIYSPYTWMTFDFRSLTNIKLRTASAIVKDYTLEYSYFRSAGYNPGGTDEHKADRSRLKLLSVTEAGKAPYLLEYNETVNLPARLSFAQDHYGYYNNKSNNTSIPTTEAFNFTGANKEPDTAAMKANVLKRVYYPTGGYTEFLLESNYGKHLYTTYVTTNKTKTVTCNTGCRHKTDSIVINFSGEIYSTNFKISYNLPEDNGERAQGYIMGPNGYFMGLNGGSGTNVNFSPLLSTPGTYYIEIEKPSNVNNAFITVTWEERKDTIYSANRIVGGLRIKQTIDHPVNGLPVTKTYDYNVPGYTDSSSLIDFRNFNYVSQFRKASSNYNGWSNWELCFAKVISSNANPRLNVEWGNVYGYGYVTVVEEQGSQKNGKTEYRFSTKVEDFVFDDQNLKTDFYIDWSKGLKLHEITYAYNPTSSTYFPLRKAYSMYKAYYDIGDLWDGTSLYTGKHEKFIYGISFRRFQRGGLLSGGGMDCTFGPGVPYHPNYCSGNFILTFTHPEWEIEPYYINSAWYHNYRDSVIQYDQNGNNPIIEKSDYYFDNVTHTLNTRTVRHINNNKLKTTYTQYPEDFAQGISYIDNLIANNLKSIPVEIVTTEKTIGQNDEKVIDAVFLSYKNDGKGNLDTVFKLITVSPVIYSSFKFSNRATGVVLPTGSTSILSRDTRYESKVAYGLYGNFSNITQIKKVDDVDQSYIWGNGDLYPIAKVLNATAANVFHTSFEDGDGNSMENDSKTGKKSKTDGFQKNLTGLVNGDYILSYWQKSGSNWNFYKSTVTVSGNSFPINLFNQVDEVRFYPKNSRMITYTYNPLVGTTSQCDENDEIIYYEYDGFGRLQTVRDKDRKVIKTMDYQYQQTNN